MGLTVGLCDLMRAFYLIMIMLRCWKILTVVHKY